MRFFLRNYLTWPSMARLLNAARAMVFSNEKTCTYMHKLICRYTPPLYKLNQDRYYLYSDNRVCFSFLQLQFVQVLSRNVQLKKVPRQFVYGHFVYDTSSTDISSTTVGLYQRTGQLNIQVLFQQIIIFINSNFYLHYDSFLSTPLPLTL